MPSQDDNGLLQATTVTVEHKSRLSRFHDHSTFLLHHHHHVAPQTQQQTQFSYIGLSGLSAKGLYNTNHSTTASAVLDLESRSVWWAFMLYFSENNQRRRVNYLNLQITWKWFLNQTFFPSLKAYFLHKTQEDTRRHNKLMRETRGSFPVNSSFSFQSSCHDSLWAKRLAKADK